VTEVGGVSRRAVTRPTFGARGRSILRAPESKRVAVLILVVALFAYLNPAFLRPASIAAVIQAMAFVGIVAVGQTLLIIAGEFDLSVGSTAALCSISAALLMTKGGLDPYLSTGLGLAIGGLVGLVNAALVLRARIPSFIATIGMLFVAHGLAVYISDAKPIHPLPPAITNIGALDTGAFSLGVAILLLLVVLGTILLRRTNFGRLLCATGGNAEAARIAGVKTQRVKAILFVTTGILAGLSGILSIIHFGSATATTGTGWELSAIAAVVVGGTSLFGGGGTVIGTLIGLTILQTITSGLVAARIDPWWQTVTIGVIMLASVSVDVVRRRARPV
jgi:ribose transport system permease protein